MGESKISFPPDEGMVIRTIEAHTGGEALRVIVDGFPPLPGDTILAKRRHAEEHHDRLRRSLMWEPRGHTDMYGALLTDPVTPDGDIGVLFMHNQGFSTMCGHGVIALATVMLETGMIDPGEERPVIRMDTPAGRVTAVARRAGRRVEEVAFRNVPSFVYARDRTVEVPGIGFLCYDVAFGGAFYAVIQAEDLGVDLEGGDMHRLVDLCMRVKRAVMDTLPIHHPFEEDLGFLYGTIVVGPPAAAGNHSRNVCVFADGEVDRSPTGTGVSARAALHHAWGDLPLNEPFTVESVLGTCMTGRVIEETQYGPYPAVVPEITGSAHLTGRCEWWIDPADPLMDGFLLR